MQVFDNHLIFMAKPHNLRTY